MTTLKLGVQLNSDQTRAVDEIEKWWKSQNLFWTLIGAAGTGKTFTTLYIIEQLGIKSICVSAPTHKARKVVEQVTKCESATVHSLLGYRPDEDLDKIKINDIKFKRKNKPTISNYKLIIIDEASMLNKVMFQDIKDLATKDHVKVLFIGDAMQLPPIGEDCSMVFSPANVDGISELRQPARQKPENPLALLLLGFRADIGDSDARSYLMTGLMELGLDGQCPEIMKTCTNIFAYGAIYKSIKQHLPVYVNEHGGYMLTNDEAKFQKKLLQVYTDNFDESPEYVKMLAFTNKRVSEYNRFIRNDLFDNPSKDLIVGDRIMGYKTITRLEDKRYIPILTNSEEYSVETVDDIMSSENIMVSMITLQDMEGKRTTVTCVDPKDYKRFKEIHEYFLSTAKENKTMWGAYYAFKNAHLVLHSLNDKTEDLPNKDLDYAYGLTVHKSQGSTYDEVFVDTVNIMESYKVGLANLNRYGTPSQEDMAKLIKFTLRLLYVAFSRPRYKAYGLI